MSSFIVDAKTINRILTYLHLHKGQMSYSYITRRAAELGYDLESNSGLSELGTDLLGLNYRATNARYNEENGLQQLHIYKFEHVSQLQALKSLQCLKYQCSEGDVPESVLFKFLEDCEHAIMSSIIRAMPEYENTQWG